MDTESFSAQSSSSSGRRYSDGESFLSLAIRSGKSWMVDLFLEKGSDPNEVYGNGQSALSLALQLRANTHSSAIIVCLLKNMNSLQLADSSDRSQLVDLLIEAIRGKDKGLLDVLLNKVDLDLLSTKGELPLLVAISEKNLELVEKMLKLPIHMNQMDSKENMALHLAVNLGATEIVRLLTAHGAQLNLVDNYGHTPLHIAAAAGSRDLVVLLLQNGADPTLLDYQHEKSAAEMARLGRHSEVENLLISFSKITEVRLLKDAVALKKSLLSSQKALLNSQKGKKKASNAIDTASWLKTILTNKIQNLYLTSQEKGLLDTHNTKWECGGCGKPQALAQANIQADGNCLCRFCNECGQENYPKSSGFKESGLPIQCVRCAALVTSESLRQCGLPDRVQEAGLLKNALSVGPLSSQNMSFCKTPNCPAGREGDSEAERYYSCELCDFSDVLPAHSNYNDQPDLAEAESQALKTFLDSVTENHTLPDNLSVPEEILIKVIGFTNRILDLTTLDEAHSLKSELAIDLFTYVDNPVEDAGAAYHFLKMALNSKAKNIYLKDKEKNLLDRFTVVKECLICGDNYETPQSAMNGPANCACLICSDCAGRHIEFELAESGGKVICCSGCRGIVQSDYLRRMNRSEEEVCTFLERNVSRGISKSLDWKFCITPDCSGGKMVPAGEIAYYHCHLCDFEGCLNSLNCKLKHTGGCDDYKDNHEAQLFMKKVLEQGRLAPPKRGHSKDLKHPDYYKGRFRPCPFCGKIWEKEFNGKQEEGQCSNMVCGDPRCAKPFNWNDGANKRSTCWDILTQRYEPNVPAHW